MTQTRTIYHVEFGSLGRGLTGGENCLCQLVRVLAERGEDNVVITTELGREKLEIEGLAKGPHIRFRTIPTAAAERGVGAFFSYLHRSVAARRMVNDLRLARHDVIICNSELLPNVLAFRRLTRRGAETRPVYWLRLVAPDWSRGYDGQFSGRARLPSPGFVHFKIAQKLYLSTVRRSGRVLVQNAWSLDRLARARRPPELRLVSSYPGRPELEFDPGSIEKCFDLAWMGRFHPQKGLFDLIGLMRRLLDRRPGSTLLVIGGGEGRIRRKFDRLCRRAGIDRAVTLTGAVSGSRRFRELARARIFLLTSRYEGAPNVEIEAMTCGLPVFRYDLPIFAGRAGGRRSVPLFDTGAMVDEAARLLENRRALGALAADAAAEAATHSWAGVADQILAAAEPGKGS